MTGSVMEEYPHWNAHCTEKSISDNSQFLGLPNSRSFDHHSKEGEVYEAASLRVSVDRIDRWVN